MHDINKISYRLKTSNDLIFDFEHDEKVLVKDGSSFKEIDIQDFDSYEELPIWVEIEEERYSITYFSKTKEVV